MRNAGRNTPVLSRRVALIAGVIFGWAVYRLVRDYRAHGGWDPVDLVSTGLGAFAGLLIGVGFFWLHDRIAAKAQR